MSEIYDPKLLFPPSKYILHKKVAIFDEHKNPSKSSSKPKEITKADLEKLAKNCNKKFTDMGLAVPLTIGHTKDDADEEDQPKICGYSTNFRVDKLGNTDRYALYCDWHVKRQFEDAVDKYPMRSIELYMDRMDINPISLLSTASERDLPIIRYSKDSNDSVYRYSYLPPSPKSENVEMNENEKMKVADAVAGESSSDKQLATEVANLKQQMGQITSMLQELMQAVSGEGEGNDTDSGGGEDNQADLLSQMQDEDGDDMTDDSAGNDDQDKKAGEKKPEKKAAAETEDPEQYAANAGPDNTFIPGMEKKTKMSRTKVEEDELVVKYERMAKKLVKDATEAVMKENEDLRFKFNRSEAEKAMYALETDHNVDFGSKEDKEEELTLLTDLLSYDKEGKSFKTHCDKIVRKYKRKEAAKPDSAGVANVLRFSRTPNDNTPAFGGADDVAAFVKARETEPTLTTEAWATRRKGTK